MLIAINFDVVSKHFQQYVCLLSVESNFNV